MGNWGKLDAVLPKRYPIQPSLESVATQVIHDQPSLESGTTRLIPENETISNGCRTGTNFSNIYL